MTFSPVQLDAIFYTKSELCNITCASETLPQIQPNNLKFLHFLNQNRKWTLNHIPGLGGKNWEGSLWSLKKQDPHRLIKEATLMAAAGVKHYFTFTYAQ